MRYLIFGMILILSACAPSITGKSLLEWRATHTGLPYSQKIPLNESIRIGDLVFHDWAYPMASRLSALPNDQGRVFLKAGMDSESRKFHGLKFRLDLSHNYREQLHRSGPKLIGFLERSRGSLIRKMKRQYQKRDILTMKGIYLGQLPASVWGTDGIQVQETDMPAFLIQSVGVW